MVRIWTWRSFWGPIPSLARLPSCKATGLGAGKFFFFNLLMTDSQTARAHCHSSVMELQPSCNGNWTNSIDPFFGPHPLPSHDPRMIQDDFNAAAIGSFPNALASSGDDSFALPIHFDNTAEVSSSLQVPSIAGQDLTSNDPLAYVPLLQVPTTNAGDFACTHLGCDKKFTRRPDMLRHAKVHDPNARKFDCSFAGCPRKGRHGFPRSDKLLAHERAHRRAIQKAQDRAARCQYV